ncbi:MAG: hypothetical protein ACJ76V_03805 [Thermoleophilaceae bacterium]
MLLLAVAAGALALGLAACGSGGSSSSAKQTLDKAFSTPIKSADLSMDLQVKLDGSQQLSGPIQLRVTGPYHSNGQKQLPEMDLQASVSAGGTTVPFGFTTTTKNVWVSVQNQAYELGAQATAQINQQLQQQQKSGQGKTPLSQLGIDPLSWVKDAKEESDANVAGTSTKHVSGKLDVSKMLDDLNKAVKKAPAGLGGTQKPQPLTDKQRAEVQKVVKDPRIDVYVAKSDNTLRRIAANLQLNVPENQRSQVGGIKGGTVAFSLEFANVGNAKAVSPPKHARPLADLTSQLGGGLGGLGSGSSGSGSGSSGSSGSNGSSGSGSSGSPSASDFQKYSECLRKAGSDTSAQAKCAKLLNGG